MENINHTIETLMATGLTDIFPADTMKKMVLPGNPNNPDKDTLVSMRPPRSRAEVKLSKRLNLAYPHNTILKFALRGSPSASYESLCHKYNHAVIAMDERRDSDVYPAGGSIGLTHLDLIERVRLVRLKRDHGDGYHHYSVGYQIRPLDQPGTPEPIDKIYTPMNRLDLKVDENTSDQMDRGDAHHLASLILELYLKRPVHQFLMGRDSEEIRFNVKDTERKTGKAHMVKSENIWSKEQVLDYITNLLSGMVDNIILGRGYIRITDNATDATLIKVVR